MKSGIYAIKNTINNKVYIGSAVNIDKRWVIHKIRLRQGKHHSEHLQHAWNKDGEQNFKFEVLEKVQSPLHLISYEQVYLDYYKSYERECGYNICKFAGSSLGIKHTEEAKQKMSEAKTGRVTWNKGKKGTYSNGECSGETRKKISEAKKGRKHSEETKRKMSEAAKRRITTEETKQKLSEANKGRVPWNKGRKHTEETRRKMSESKAKKNSALENNIV
jgi:group I intron endonuclease